MGKFTYIEYWEKPMSITSRLVYRENVTGMDKKTIREKMAKLDQTYDADKFTGFTSTVSGQATPDANIKR